MPDGERAEIGAGPDGVLPDDEHERHEQVGRVGGQGMRAPDALTDVPRVHPVVHQLAGGVDEGRHRPHVHMRDDEPAPLLGRQRLEDAHHLVEIAADAAHHLRLRDTAERAPAVAGQFMHDGQPVCVRAAACPGGLEGLEVPLGGVDDVPNDVADLPFRARGGSLPRAGCLGHREHAFRLFADDPEDGVLPLIGHRIPRAHCGPSPRMSAPFGPEGQPWRAGRKRCRRWRPSTAQQFTSRTSAHHAPTCQCFPGLRYQRPAPLRAPSCERDGWKRLAHRVAYPVP
jgi:hypothetical protein